MTFFRSLLFVCPLACMVAQTPPPKPAAQPASSKPASQAAPKPAQAAQPAAPKAASESAAPKPAQAAQPAPAPVPAAPAPAEMPVVPADKVVISVGDEKLTFAQFEGIINSLPEQYRATAKGAGRKQFADNLVRVMVLSQEGKRRKLDETATFKSQVAFQTENVLAGAAFEDINKNLKVGEAEERAFYDSHLNDFEEVRARHILIRMQGSQVPVRPGQKDLTDAEALAKAQELRKKIVDGADFATIAIQESDDTGSGAKGGDLGAFHHQQMVPTFEQAAFSLKPGEISQPVRSQFGYHIIKVESHETKSFDDVKDVIATRLRPQLLQKYMDDLQKQSNVSLDPELFGAAPAAPPTPAAAPAAAKSPAPAPAAKSPAPAPAAAK
jgi:peptidyl-prolyl cis-trans isomerase C